MKILLYETDVNIVAAGLPYCRRVFETNKQLKRRFRTPIELPRFDWSIEEDRLTFRSILNTFQEQLAPFNFPDLASDDMSFRFYCATGGLLGLLSNIFTEAIENAIDNEQFDITFKDIEIAFLDSIFDLDIQIINPFTHNFDATPSTEIVNSVKQIIITDSQPVLTKEKRKQMRLSEVLRK